MSETKNPINELDLELFLRDTPGLKTLSSFRAELLAGDGSGRSFYRVLIEGVKVKSAILLYTPEGIGPKLSGDTSYSQEQAFVELCKYFPSVGVAAPKFYNYNATQHWVLMEDVGRLPLYYFLERKNNSQIVEEIHSAFAGEATIPLFKKAIDLISTLQALPVNNSVICFRRHLAFENYRLEISEFSDYYAAPLGLSKSAASELDKIYDSICETIISFPKALSLFDYNSHNLFVSDQADLRVLDFQDACMVSPARDLVSLINDRSMDQLLGKTRHEQLLKYAIEKLNFGQSFSLIYNITLLHWDLRVAGRFIKLNNKFNTDKYSQWLPSTLQRLGRTLKRSEKTIHGLSTLLEIAYALSPEIRDGFSDPWNLPA